jgi:hypothetical protein
MMICSPLSHPEDLKPLIKTAIQLVTSPEDTKDEYASLRFAWPQGKLGSGPTSSLAYPQAAFLACASGIFY